MPFIKYFVARSNRFITFFIVLIFSVNTNATDIEITPFIGQTFSADLISSDALTTINVSDEQNFGLSIAWQESIRGQGQITFNYISRDFASEVDQSTQSFDTFYAHFSGVAFFKERSYVTTVGFGIGGTYFDSDNSSVLYPSLTAAIGTRYEFSNNFALVTELRAYATLTDEDEDIFCTNSICAARFDNTVWIDTNISIGFSYKF